MEFNTVDGFQGREVDILILSTVRASVSSYREQGSKSNSIGFVADVRRMNVALTRAKHSLWIIGNARTLQTNPHWCALVNDARERNLFMSVARPYGSAFKNAPCSAQREASSPQLGASSSQHKKAKAPKKESERRGNRAAHGQVSERVDGGEGQGTGLSSIRQPHGDRSKNHEISRRRNSGSDKSKADVSGGHMEDLHAETSTRKTKRTHRAPEPPSGPATDGQPPAVGRNKGKDEESKEKNDGSGNPGEDIISKRKRQREAVDALLSSALISSKKPESLPRPAPKRRP